MKHLLSCILLLFVSMTVLAQNEIPKKKGDHFIVPWKPAQNKAYREKNMFVWKQGAGYFVNDFIGLEGSIYKLNYYEKFRYNPYEQRNGFVRPEDYTVNVLGMGKLPLNEYFALFGKVGPAYNQNPFDSGTSSSSSAYATAESNPLQVGVTYSTGARLALSPSLELSVEYMNTQNEYMELEGTMAQMNWNF